MIRTIAFAIALLTALPVAAQQQVGSYLQCMEAIRTNAEKGLEAALQWRDMGGGTPARHCAAIGYAATGQQKVAAAQLQTLAEDLSEENKKAAAEVMSQAAAMWTLGKEDRKALLALNQAIAWRPKNPGNYLDRALLFASQKKYGKAEQSATQAIELDDLMVEAYAVRAMIRREAGDFPGSEEDTATALALDPKDPHALMERARSRARGGDMDGARADLTDLIARDPEAAYAESARRVLEELELKYGGG